MSNFFVAGHKLKTISLISFSTLIMREFMQQKQLKSYIGKKNSKKSQKCIDLIFFHANLLFRHNQKHFSSENTFFLIKGKTH